ncbi:MAG TPA: hypothetical protein PKU95_03800 [Candidatus Dojkabacteria bacterium]|nr:hypothetical protein [Candidatus Dojkabacteria bacterium]
MKINTKQFIAISLIVATILIGGAAIYVGIRLGQQPSITPDEIEALTGPDGIIYGTNCSSQVTIENGTVCINFPSGYAGTFVGKHWCDTDQWLSAGCNCPLTASCDQQHEMADGSIEQQGLYYPSSAQCSCSDGNITNGPACSSSSASTPCALNLFQSAPFATKICLDRVPGDRSRTYCGLQQIDVASTSCFLSGLLANVPECQDVEVTPTPQFTCGDYGCTNDEQCDGGLPTYECDESSNPAQNRCVQVLCPSGEELDESTEWPCDCKPISGSPTPTLTPTNTGTPTITPTGSLTVTPSRTPTGTPTRTPTGTPTKTPTGTPSKTVTPTTPPGESTTPTLPPTALISNEVDLVLIGLVITMAGIAIYRSGAYISLGNLYWNNGGEKVSGALEDINTETKAGINSVKRVILIIDSTLTKLILSSKQIIEFAIKYVAGIFGNIKDTIVLSIRKLLFKTSKNKKDLFEQEVIISQQDKQDKNNE